MSSKDILETESTLSSFCLLKDEELSPLRVFLFLEGQLVDTVRTDNYLSVSLVVMSALGFSKVSPWSSLATRKEARMSLSWFLLHLRGHSERVEGGRSHLCGRARGVIRRGEKCLMNLSVSARLGWLL